MSALGKFFVGEKTFTSNERGLYTVHIKGVSPDVYSDAEKQRAALEARVTATESELKRVVQILCETRGHAGNRPCKFCSDTHLHILPKEE